MWPKYLDREVTQRVELGRRSPAGTREEPLQDGLGPQALFGFEWQLSPHGEELTDDEMDELARTTSRSSSCATTGSGRLRGRSSAPQAADPHRHPVQALAATLTGVVDIEDSPYEAVVGASLLTVRDRVREAASGELVEVPAGLQAELRDYQCRGLSWLAELTGSASAPAWPTTWVRQDDHADRAAPPP